MTDSPVFAGVDVSKTRSDIAVRPAETRSPVPHDEAGLATVVEQLRQLQLTLVVLEATGGLEVVLSGALAAAGSSSRARCGTLLKPRDGWRRPMPSTRRCWRSLPTQCGPPSGPCQKLARRNCPLYSPAAGRLRRC